MPEFAPTWTRSTYCASGQCIEVAHVGDSVLVRDSKDIDASHLRFSADEWDNFCRSVAAGEFTFS